MRARDLLLLVALVVQGANAIRVSVRPSPSLTSTPAGSVKRAVLSMQEGMEEGVESLSEKTAAPMEDAPQGGYETFYDDEKEDAVLKQKEGISNAMRERLLNESRGLGADANSKNPFLPVFFGFGVFVLLGALAVNL